MNAVELMQPWYVRLWRSVRRTFELGPIDFRAGADYSPGNPVAAGYDPAKALSAYAGNPWMYATANAIATDLSGLPIRVRKGRGKNAVVIDDHPVLALIEQPTRAVDGITYRRQRWTDLPLAGAAYSVIVDGGLPADPPRVRPNLVGLVRVHPARMYIVPDLHGQPLWFEYRHAGTIVRYHPSRVLHIRMQSWEDDPREMHGTGATRTLHRDLVADAALADRSAAASRAGRPAALAKPIGGSPAWSASTIKEFKDALSRVFRDNDGGIAVLGAPAEIEILGWSPDELKIAEQRYFVRDTLIAAMGATPTRVGIPTANYAQSREQSVVYWTNLRGLAKIEEVQLTRLARMYGDPDVTVYHDFGEVDALQDSRDARLTRAERLVLTFGADPAEALAYEGLADAPVGAVTGALPVDDDLPRATKPAILRSPTRPQRAVLWRGWVARQQSPAETLVRAAALRWLGDARRRTVSRARLVLDGRVGERSSFPPVAINGVPVRREQISDAEFARIFPLEEERAQLRKVMGDRISKILERAFRLAAKDIGVDALPPRDLATRQLGELIKGVTDTTRAAVREAVISQLDNGATVDDIAIALQRDAAFGPVRAQTIARTESARAVNGGTNAAISAAAADGIRVRKQWLSARDAAVRDAHESLDGVTVEADAAFEIDGSSADAPGNFGVAELDINCRCAVRPILED